MSFFDRVFGLVIDQVLATASVVAPNGVPQIVAEKAQPLVLPVKLVGAHGPALWLIFDYFQRFVKAQSSYNI